jgi:hypothetical protein
MLSSYYQHQCFISVSSSFACFTLPALLVCSSCLLFLPARLVLRASSGIYSCSKTSQTLHKLSFPRNRPRRLTTATQPFPRYTPQIPNSRKLSSPKGLRPPHSKSPQAVKRLTPNNSTVLLQKNLLKTKHKQTNAAVCHNHNSML